MPNQLRFTSPVALPDITLATIREARRINDSAKTLDLEVAFYADAVQPPTPEPTEAEPDPKAPQPISFALDSTVVLTVSNEGCTRLRVNPYPKSAADLWLVDWVQVPHAFDQVLGAYFAAGGNTGALAKLQQLGLLPAGSAS